MARRPKAETVDPRQLGLFDRPLPAKPRPMDERSSMGRLPLEHAYSADEARLLREGLSVETAGILQGADPYCLACSRYCRPSAPGRYVETIYRADGTLRRRCCLCRVPFPGMTGREHLGRNKPAWPVTLAVPTPSVVPVTSPSS